MDQNQRNLLAMKINEAAIYFGKHDLSKDQIITFINICLNHFREYDFDKIILAIDRYVLDSKNKFFFSPATLRPYLNPELSMDAKANEAASRIRSAIAKYGWSNPDDAEEYIGTLGWKIVERAGGWSYICENHGLDLNPLTFHAQAREQVKALLESSSLGEFDKPIQLSEPKRDLAVLDQLKKTNNLGGLIDEI